MGEPGNGLRVRFVMANRVIRLSFQPFAILECEECGLQEQGDPVRIQRKARSHARQKKHVVSVDKVQPLKFEGISDG